MQLDRKSLTNPSHYHCARGYGGWQMREKAKKKKKGWEKKGKGWIPSFVKHAIYKKGRDMNKKKKKKNI